VDPLYGARLIADAGPDVHLAQEAEGDVMSTQRADDQTSRRLPTRDEMLARGKPFPRYEEMVIEGLTDEEEDVFLKAIAEA
jgi:hypothetical protein